ncbi:hypothetical protein [Musicola keenii]|uniref:hypothetical protein n=1 Tax=Musicola keenii TaxID=2884250 RepID=UPI00178455A8|nr:hypothetical protein [Musicola keenii]
MVNIIDSSMMSTSLGAHKVMFHPALWDIPENTLALGVGNPSSSGIVLSHKNGREHFRSLSAWLWAMSHEKFHETIKHKTAEPINQIIVEDFSLDTCLAWILFQLRVWPGFTHYPAELEAWVNYVDLWEQGFHLESDDITHSAACLHTAYAHAQLNAAKNHDDHYDAEKLHAGFAGCIRLLIDFINQSHTPTQGIQPLPTLEFHAAESALNYEYQFYQLTIARAATCQLLVEQQNSRRKLMVDALFLNEQHASGLFKIFARNDRQRSWCKNGFTLLGIYRQQEQGTGNDIVISVDPRSNLSLEKLWRALEAKENERWNGSRPCDTPRPLRSYIDPHRSTDNAIALLPGAPNQPWWDDEGRYTLIAAPKMLDADQRVMGSQLDWWQDVLPLIWQHYFVQHISPYLEEIKPTLTRAPNHKYLCALRWLQPDQRLQQTDITAHLMDTPSFHAWLATCSQPPAAQTPYTLPASDEYEAYWQEDVLTIIHEHGVTLFSRRPDNPTLQELLVTAERIAVLSADYAQFLQQTHHIFRKWPSLLRENTQKIKDKQWEEEIFQLRLNALHTLDRMDTLSIHPQENRLNNALQRHWGLHAQRENLFAQLDRLDALVNNAISRQKAYRHRIYGSLFSALGLGVAASHVWEPIRESLSTNTFEWQLLLFKDPMASHQQLQAIAAESAHYELITLGIFLAFALLGFILFWFFDIRSEE